ncbi:MAG TPA: glycosyltransferase family 9 protein [Micromonosporaceae bacterium]
MTERYTDILVVDLLGGIGDLVMVLPAIHGLARRYPDAALRVLTHEPGAELLRGDPAVADVYTPRHGRPGAEREAVLEVLAAHPPALAITTTRYDGIPDLLVASGARCVTDLWRRPPVHERIGDRYLQILCAEGLLDPDDVISPSRVHLWPAELAQGARTVAARLPREVILPPVVLVTEAGMKVKQWPPQRWRRLAGLLAAAGHPLLTVGPPHAGAGAALPRGSLRQLAAVFAAVAAQDGVVVGGDTGPVRLAAAMGARTVALFGPTLALRYGIGRDLPPGVDLQGLPECGYRQPTAITEQVCWWSGRCPLSPAGPACMADLRPEVVAAEVARVTGPWPAAGRSL